LSRIPKDIGHRFLIVGEGERDQAFFNKLIDHHGLEEFEIGFAEGNTKFVDFLGGLKLHKDFSKLAAVVLVSDNNGDPENSFNNVRTQVEAAGGYGVTNRPLAPAKAEGFPTVVIRLPYSSHNDATLGR
jgi:hypothetical protein